MLLVHDQDVPERPCRGRARGRSPPSRWRRRRGVVLPRGADLPCDAWLQPAQAGGRVGAAEEEAGRRRPQAASDNEEEEEERRCTEEARRQAGEAAAAARECTPHAARGARCVNNQQHVQTTVAALGAARFILQREKGLRPVPLFHLFPSFVYPPRGCFLSTSVLPATTRIVRKPRANHSSGAEIKVKHL